MALHRGALGLSAVCDCGIFYHTDLLFLSRDVQIKLKLFYIKYTHDTVETKTLSFGSLEIGSSNSKADNLFFSFSFKLIKPCTCRILNEFNHSNFRDSAYLLSPDTD